MSKPTFTKQGIRDLNGLGGKRINGRKKVNPIICPHPEFRIEEYEEDGGVLIQAKTCVVCGFSLSGEEEIVCESPN